MWWRLVVREVWEREKTRVKKQKERERAKKERKRGSHQQSSDLTCCEERARASSVTKCQLSPWATDNEEGFVGNIRH